jgi:hypothetical protein
VGTIGNEGFVGLPVLLGDQQAPTTVYMQVAGAGLKIDAKLFKREVLQSPSLQVAMLHYAHAFFNQVVQSAACAHFHTLEGRCCRWLLMTAALTGRLRQASWREPIAALVSES